MPEVFDITVENKLGKDKRDINVYHHSTRGAHLISHNCSITLPLGTAKKGDYLHISVVRGPGDLKTDCLINVPSWTDFEFASEGKVTLAHSSDRILLKIPPGPPKWELKMTRPLGTLIGHTPDHVTIGDSQS
ncbi:MAG: hypothetical protein GTO45_39175 [Candidatus Aminicenantes bacterium]|nr:hypothetical protein [Candidatus Aminicenantes bacterium]NIM84647.1 hypothetical protein [Candidatus Aminicenantes bacterium]NIN24152.1 hypothetical protein [Candidatus Aminicenantes bacterium]NIN47876.1 hypothetical protein [Candidatus Aminicenantes bacterium]NIN90814.1 hypothetical protein [Candidatus Aminicenantes bacterium]